MGGPWATSFKNLHPLSPRFHMLQRNSLCFNRAQYKALVAHLSSAGIEVTMLRLDPAQNGCTTVVASSNDPNCANPRPADSALSGQISSHSRMPGESGNSSRRRGGPCRDARSNQENRAPEVGQEVDKVRSFLKNRMKRQRVVMNESHDCSLKIVSTGCAVSISISLWRSTAQGVLQRDVDSHVWNEAVLVQSARIDCKGNTWKRVFHTGLQARPELATQNITVSGARQIPGIQAAHSEVPSTHPVRWEISADRAISTACLGQTCPCYCWQ